MAGTYRRLTAEEEKEVLREIREKDHSLKDIAKKYGISQGKIWNLQKRYNAFRTSEEKKMARIRAELEGEGARKEDRASRDAAGTQQKQQEPLHYRSAVREGYTNTAFMDDEMMERWTEVTTRILKAIMKERQIKQMQAETYKDGYGKHFRVQRGVEAGKEIYGTYFSSPGRSQWRRWSKKAYETETDAIAELRDEAKKKGWEKV